MTFELLYILIIILILLIPIWGLIATQICYKQRKYLLDNWPQGMECWQYIQEFEQVSYSTHMWYVFFFRNPRQLYGPLNNKIFGYKYK